ncbi:HlyD family secretion protein [Massilia sp. DWR3-1-1]|uniref:HlyD family secretion protein n=1 Tax=Massilia sp. DWR3-1-1 TaxID=2804559 RepID=UPI003CF87020
MKRLPCFAIAVALVGCARAPDEGLPGYAEGETVRLAAPLTGTLTRLYLRTGDQAAQGSPAFTLERDVETAERAEALARLQRASAQLADLRKGQRPDELAAARARLDQAEAAQLLSQAELARQQTLFAARFSAPAQQDAARAAAQRDQARVGELRAQLRLAGLGARSDAIAAAAQDQQAAQAQLAQAEWKLAQKAQTIPQAGTVVEVYYREGELVPAGSPVLSVLPPANIKARFFVREDQLGTLAIGRAVELRCDGCGAPVAAAITFIAPNAEFTAPLIYSNENRARLVFMVEARPAPAQAARLHPGQPLQVRLTAPP